MDRKPYPTDLTDAQWKRIKPWIPADAATGRPPEHAKREFLNAILYVTRNGCTWRSLPLLVAAGATVASSQELLTNPGIEIPTSPAGWTLDEFATDPSVTDLVNSAISAGLANQEIDGTSGLWLRPFIGAQVGSNMELVNAVLSQSAPAVAGESYTFSGYSSFEQNYSGGVVFLDVLSPLGAIESPAQTLFELAFLDSGGAVLGTPEVIDLRDEQFNGLGWAQHTVTASLPAARRRGV